MIGAPNAGTATTYVAGTTSMAVPYPATTHNGAVLTLAIGTFAIGITPSTPAGWTKQKYVGSGGGTAGGVGTSTGNTQLYTKVATGAEGGTSLTVTTPSTAGEAQIVEWSGVDTVNPVDLAVTAVDNSAGGTTTVTAPSVSVVTTGATLYAVATSNTAVQTGTLASWTQLSNGSGASCNLVGGYVQNVGAGASSAQVITFSGAGKQVLLVAALRPAVYGPVASRLQAVNRASTY